MMPATLESVGGRTRLAQTAAKADGIVLLVKNGIGFGHITRCLLLAEELRRLAPDVGVTLVSQAGSLLAHDGADVPVINFPLLHRLPSGPVEHTQVALLDAVLGKLAPLLVVEDTYPDPHYHQALSIRGCRRVLVQRRIDCVSFDRFRRHRRFAPYDRVLLTQSSAEFDAEGHTLASRLLVEASGRFRLLGPVYRRPTPDDLDRAKALYSPDGAPLVVVNAGAGGDHFNDAYCERLFTTMSQVAQRCLSEQISVEFAFVLGPYYGGRVPQAPPNVRVVVYEELLHALVQQARIVVARPGHNVTHETLDGPATILLVPGISWMETQPEHSQRLSQFPGVLVGDVDDSQGMFDLVRQALTMQPSSSRVASPANKAVALALLEELTLARTPPRVSAGEVFLLIRGAETRERAAVVHEHLLGACVLGHDVVALSSFPHRTRAGGAVYTDVSPSPTLSPDELRHHGVVAVMFPDHGGIGVAAREWVEHHGGLVNSGVLPVELYAMQANPTRPQDLIARAARLRRRSLIAAIVLDLAKVVDADVCPYVEALDKGLRSAGLRVVPVDGLVREHLSQLIGEA